MIVKKRQRRRWQKSQAVAQSLEELTRCFEKHCRLVNSDAVINNGEHEKIDTCHNNCPCRNEFKTTLVDTIQTLEGTRKNFKSKQIEALRRKLTETLVKL
jgi:hypothetical protein